MEYGVYIKIKKTFYGLEHQEVELITLTPRKKSSNILPIPVILILCRITQLYVSMKIMKG